MELMSLSIPAEPDKTLQKPIRTRLYDTQQGIAEGMKEDLKSDTHKKRHLTLRNG